MIWLRLFCIRCFRRIAVCKAEDIGHAAIEVTMICISAFLPLWAGLGFFAMTKQSGAAIQYGSSFAISGELLLISCAMIGPLIYVVTKKYGRLTDPLTLRFPYSTGFSLMIVLIWFIAGGVFVANKAGNLLGAELFDDFAMWALSLVIAISAIVTLFFATIFRNCLDRLDPSGLMHADQENFVSDFDNG